MTTTPHWPRGLLRWQWLLAPVTIAVLSRIFSIALLWREAAARPLVGHISPLVAWDGQWYLRIARLGYHAAEIEPRHHDFAFYPGWPLLIRAASLDGLFPMDVTAIVLANVLFVLAIVCVFRVFANTFGERNAILGTLLLSFNPASYVFSLAYSEPLFLLLVGSYFLDRYGRASPAFAALATLVRASGLAIGASAGVMWVLNRAPRRRLVLIGAAVVLAFAAWWIYLWQLTGSFTGWLEGSPSWPFHQGIDSISYVFGHHRSWVLVWLGFVAIMAVGSLLLIRRHPDMAVFGLVAIAMSIVGAPVWSMPRHSMVAFPAFAALASRLGTRISVALLVGFAVMQYIYVGLSFGPNGSPP